MFGEPFISYSQHFEDVLLWRLLGGVSEGFYIDVGANDPVELSVTKAFYDKGWHGINIEPVPVWHERLVAQRPRDMNLCIAAHDSKGSVELHELVDSGLSTTIDEYAERGAVERGFERRTYTVETDTLANIIDQHRPTGDIHFLKVDVEGAEEKVLLGADFSRHRPWIVIVEAIEPLTVEENYLQWEPLLLTKGYTFELFDGINRWYLAEEQGHLRPLLSVPVDNQISFEREHRHSQEIAGLRNSLAVSEAAVAESREHIAALERHITEMTDSKSWQLTAPLRSLRKRLRKG